MTELQRVVGRRESRLRVVPAHLAIAMSGHRQWARAAGYTSVTVAHRTGLERLADALGWCERLGVSHVSAFLLPPAEIDELGPDERHEVARVVTEGVPDALAHAASWRLHLAGAPHRLGPETAGLRSIVDDTVDRPLHLTVSIGADGREDVVAAARAAAGEHGVDRLTVERIEAALPGGPVKQLDLLVTTAGHAPAPVALWQQQHTVLHECTKPWPALARRDLRAALETFARQRGDH